MSNFISKVKGVKTHQQQRQQTKLESFNSATDVYYDAKKIPIKTKVFKENISKEDLRENSFDSSYEQRPSAGISSEKLWEFFKYCSKVRFFTSNQNPSHLVSCTYELGNIIVFVNCDQLKSQKLCKDNSIITVNQDVSRLVGEPLETIIWCLQKFFESYLYYLKKSKDGNVDVSVIKIFVEKKTFLEKVVDLITSFNLPSVDKYFREVENESVFNDRDFRDALFNNKKIQIQKIYP